MSLSLQHVKLVLLVLIIISNLVKPTENYDVEVGMKLDDIPGGDDVDGDDVDGDDVDGGDDSDTTYSVD